MPELKLTNNELLYLETILGRPQDEVEDIGDLSKQISEKLENLELDKD